MGRPSTIRDETIIEAAREVFLARGIRATTAEVAKRARVSEGTVFHRFHCKVDLFRRAMEAHIAEPAWIGTLTDRCGKGDSSETLCDVGLQLITYLRTVTPLLMMAWSNPDDLGQPSMSGHGVASTRPFERLTRFFAAEAAAGRIQAHDPEVLAHAFLGGLHSYVFFELFQAGPGSPGPGAAAFVRRHVALLWSGLAPAAQKSTRVAPQSATDAPRVRIASRTARPRGRATEGAQS